MPIIFDRSVCRDLNETISREWLATNSLGGYAAGTIAGVLTRMEHGLFVASPIETAAPQLLLAKIDEEVVFDQRTYHLGTNEYPDGILNPSGFVHLETFRLEEGFPIFTYHLGGIDGIVLEKRIWMPHGYNTTYIQYRVLRTASISTYEQIRSTGKGENADWKSPERMSSATRYQGYFEAAQPIITLTLLPLSAYRPHHQPQYGNNNWHFQVHVHHTEQNEGEQQEQVTLPKGVAGCTIRAWDGGHPYHIFAVGHPESQTTFIPTGVWYWRFLRRHDQEAGLPATDDLYLPGVIRTKLWPGEGATLTIIVTAEELSTQTFSPGQLDLSYKRSVERQRNILSTQRYFGEGGETSQQLRVLPFATTTALQPPGREGLTHSPPDCVAAPQASLRGPYEQGEEYLRLLVQAGDRFLARRCLPQMDGQLSLFNDTENIPFVLAAYYSMAESIRDTLIALPGLTLTTGRYDEARRLLRIFSRYFKQGMLPDRLPAPGRPLEESDYGSVDTTLWYFYALDHYLRVTRDYELLDELYQRLAGSIDWYRQGYLAPGQGANNGIWVDTIDGLLQAQQAGKALTWMNASVNNVPVTPREGKPVEVNALWYHALSLMHDWSQELYAMGRINYTTSSYQEQSAQCRESFQKRFWYADGNYLYDVIDGPGGDDATFRPNQLLALSLRHSVLHERHWHAVLELVTQHLITPYGLRTLAPHEAAYQGHLTGNQENRLRALHQGSGWPWLIGPYVDAWLRVEGSAPSTTPTRTGTQHEIGYREQAQRIRQKGVEVLEPFRKHLHEEMLGMIGSAFSGDAPHESGYNIASAISVGEILRVYNIFAQMDVGQEDRVFSTAIHEF